MAQRFADHPPVRPRFRLRTLGTLELRRADHAAGMEGSDAPIARVQGKSLAILAYLACSHTRSASRARLAELFWASPHPHRGMQSVRQALHGLRHPDLRDLIELAGDSVLLLPAVEVDAIAFRQHLAWNGPADALALYGGDFCEGFAADGADEFERWATVQRASFRTECVEAIARLAETALAELRSTEALALAERMRRVDPDDERHWRIALQARQLRTDHLGMRAAAVDCRRWLSEEEREPSRPLRSLLDRAEALAQSDLPNGGHSAAPRPSELTPDIVGREQQFASLLAAWADAKQGAPRCIVLGASAGLGKTRLLTAFRDRIAGKRVRIACVRALPAETSVEWALASRIVAELAALPGAGGLSQQSAAILLSLNPALSNHFRSATPAPFERRVLLNVLEAVDELAGCIAEDASLAVLIDDLHWADAESRHLLAALAERQEARRILVVLAARPVGAVSSRTPSNAIVIPLPALAASDVEQLLGSIAQLPDDAGNEWARVLESSSRGNPLVVLETIRLAMDRDAVAIDDGRWIIRDEAELASIIGRSSGLVDRLTRLSGEERKTALLLSVAGRPVPHDSLAAANGEVDGRDSVLHQLEVRDVVRRTGDGWIIAHDALAEALIDDASGETLREARTRAAAILESTGDAASLRSALDLYVAEQSWDAAAATVVTLGGSAGVLGRSSYERARHALVAVRDPAALSAIVRRLPWRARLPVHRIGAAVAGLLVLSTILGVSRLGNDVEMAEQTELIVTQVDSNGGQVARVVPLSEVGWDVDRALDLRTARRAPWPTRFSVANAAIRHDGAVASHREYADSGMVDVFLWTIAEGERRLTTARGDDLPTDWSPDGTELLIESSRHGRRGRRSLYALDVASNRIRRLTASDPNGEGGTDVGGRWSPDGSRIAFVRRFEALRPAEVCLVDSDARNERCRPLAGWVPLGVSWLDADALIVPADSGDATRSSILDLSEWSLAPLVEDCVCGVSPGGQWLLCHTTEGPYMVAPTSRPTALRRVGASPAALGDGVGWLRTRRDPRMIARVDATAPLGVVMTDVAVRLTAVLRNVHGEVIDGVPLRWSIDDTTRGSISADGTLIPTRPGRITVYVSAGGWRNDSVAVRVMDAEATPILREEWAGGVTDRWRYFGEPLPTVVKTAGAHAFWNRGEGTYFSGAYLRRPVPARNGLWLEAAVSTRLTATLWQVLILQIFEWDGDRTVDAWDHSTGYFPKHPFVCSYIYPANEGMHWMDRIGPGGYIPSVLPYPADSLRSGAWYRVLLQLFPDGRCGVAIDGIPVNVTEIPRLVPASVRVVLQGSSDQTKILVGPLTIGRGVRRDVNWSRAGTLGSIDRSAPPE